MYSLIEIDATGVKEVRRSGGGGGVVLKSFLVHRQWIHICSWEGFVGQ